MPDEKPPIPAPEDESKKDTVRINLPPGLMGRSATPAGPPPAAKLKPTPPPGTPEDESKKETAVMGMPIATPKPKKDTSRVQVSAAKPTAPETPRPTVRLKREEPAPAGAPAAAAAPLSAAPVLAATPSGADAGLAIGAMVLSVVVLVYLAMVAFG